jgi:hypothetical protein
MYVSHLHIHYMINYTTFNLKNLEFMIVNQEDLKL